MMGLLHSARTLDFFFFFVLCGGVGGVRNSEDLKHMYEDYSLSLSVLFTWHLYFYMMYHKVQSNLRF